MLITWTALVFTAMTTLSVAVDLVRWAQQLSSPVNDARESHAESASRSAFPRRPPPFQR